MFRIFFVVVLLSIVATFTPAQTAFAGSTSTPNAKQIYFSCPTSVQGVSVADYVVIYGKNQRGDMVRWRGNAYWKSDKWSTFVFTKDRWWVGKVNIAWWNSRSQTWNNSFYVVPPEQINGGTVNFTCATSLW